MLVCQTAYEALLGNIQLCSENARHVIDDDTQLKENKSSIVCEVHTFEKSSCLDIEATIDSVNIGNEVRSNLSSETRLKVEVEDRLKADEEAKAVEDERKMEKERRMNEIIALEEEMRLKKERWLVEEQMLHVQEERKTSMKEEQKCLPEERCKRMNEQNQLLNEEQEKLSDEDMEVTQAIEKVLVPKGEQVQTRSADQYAVAQSVVVEKEKEEISVDVIKDKDDLNLVILSKERIDFDEDEIEEEKLKLPKRKCKNLSRRTVAELQQKVNLKASSNMVLIPQHWSLRREYWQDKSGIGKLAWKLTDFIKRDGTVRIRRSLRENRSTRKRVRLKLTPQHNIYRDGKIRGETRHLDFKIVDPTWMKKGVARKLRESEIEFQKRCLKRRAKPKVTIRGDKASHRLYWDRGKKRSSRDIIIMYLYNFLGVNIVYAYNRHIRLKVKFL
ncbi:uncharacterized protein TNCV_3498441 [Trichonephila clavipes]|nr:uncharacterized protein TNCV_3498441 [Trichonephila clavipes]